MDLPILEGPVVREPDPIEQAEHEEAQKPPPGVPDDFEQPKMDCPRCGKEYDDFDGIGVVYCAPPDGCGYCRHLARTGGICDVCGDARPERDDRRPDGVE